MNVIFLDLDGVLNHEKFFLKRLKLKPETWHERYFCSQSVEKLNKITDETGAKIVFSSSHRFRFKTLQELKDNFKLAGVKGELIGITPKLKYENNPYSVPRGCEIKAWIENNKGILGDKVSKFKYAILDDDSDMLYWQRKSFFKTSRKTGITDSIVKRVIKHLC